MKPMKIEFELAFKYMKGLNGVREFIFLEACYVICWYPPRCI